MLDSDEECEVGYDAGQGNPGVEPKTWVSVNREIITIATMTI